MPKRLFHILLLVGGFAFAELGMTSCASHNNCPAVAGTGNSATKTGGFRLRGKKGCAGVTGTGTSKPRVKRKKEDGLMSSKMEKQMQKAERKDSSPVQSRTLSVDQ